MAASGDTDVSEARVCVAAVAGAFGVRGEARLKPFTAEPFAVADYGPLSTEAGDQRFEVRVTRPLKNGFVAARLSGVGTREAAEELKGVRLYAPRAALPEPEEDEFYHADLIGLIAEDLDGVARGRVKAVLNHGAGDILEIAPLGDGRPVLMAFTLETAPRVDLAAGRVVIDPPLGVFADEEDADDEPGDASERTA